MSGKAVVLLGGLALAAVGFVLWTVSGGSGAGDVGPPEDGSARVGAEIAAGERPLLQGAPEIGHVTPAPAEAPAAVAPPAVPLPVERAEGRVAGRVTDAEGKGIAGARVHLERDVDRREGSSAVSNTIADAEGWFSFDGIAEGSYRVRVEAPGYAGSSLSTRPGEDPLALTLAVGLTMSGTVVDAETQQPIVGLLLTARPAASPDAGDALTAWTREDGGFRFEGLPSGDFVLAYGTHFQADPGVGHDLLSGRLDPLPAGTQDLRIAVTRGRPIAGSLRDRSGRAVTRIVGVEAIGWTDGGEADYTRRGFTLSGTDGGFRLEGLPPGLYTLTFEPRTDGATSTDPTVATKKVDHVLAGTEDLVVELDEGAVLLGRLVDEDGNAVSGRGYVYVHPQGTNPGSPESVPVSVDAEGRFHTPPLDPATPFDILATGFPGTMQASVRGIHPGDREIVITLPRAASITGRVVDEAGLPVPAGVGVLGAVVGVSDPALPGTRPLAYTGDRGLFRLEAIPGRAYVLRAGGGPSAYVPAGEAKDVRAGTTDVVLKAALGVRVKGRLVDSHGAGVRTHYLVARDPAPGAALACWTHVDADDGRFVIPGVKRGAFLLGATVGGRYVSLGRFETTDEELTVVVPGE